MRVVFSGSIFFLLSACVSAAPPSRGVYSQINLATYPGGMIVTTSRAGSFAYQGGCLLFRDTAGRTFLPVLKSGSTLVDKTLSIAGSANRRTVRLGDRVVLEGDGQDWANVPISYHLSTYQYLCSVPPFFVVNTK